MDENKRVKHIMSMYLGKKFSKNGREMFGRWLQAEEGKAEKNAFLEECWEQSETSLGYTSYEDWIKLRKRIQGTPSSSKKIFIRPWLNYAAVILLVLISGTVMWFAGQSHTKQTAQMAEVFIPFGDSRTLLLPDSSEVWLNAGSLLVYPTDFDQSETRTIYLTGEATFMVRKNPEKPFMVKTNHITVQALGTIFTVKSYPMDSCTTTTLEEGSVLVEIKDRPDESTILKPDQQYVYSHYSHSAHIKKIDATLYKLERKGYMIFENVSFNQLIQTLERKFNVVIQYNSQKFAGQYYNVKFAPEETLEEVLHVLEQLMGIHYTIKENTVIIN